MKEKKNRVCPTCGRELPFEDSSCPYCGTPVKKKKQDELKRTFLGVILPVIVAVSISQGVKHFMRYQNENRRNILEEIEATVPDIPILDPKWRPEVSTEPMEPEGIWQNDELWEAKFPDIDEDLWSCMADTAFFLRESSMSEGEIRSFLQEAGHSQEDMDQAMENFSPDWNQRAAMTVPLYLQESASSRATVLKLLTDSGFTPEQAQWGIENGDVDWVKVGAGAVLQELEMDPRGPRELMADMIEFRDFTREEVEAGMAAADIDWREIAGEDVRRHMESYPVSPVGLQNYLEARGHEQKIAEELIRDLPIDWSEEALRMTLDRDWDKRTKEEVIRELTAYQGFHQEDAEYAARKARCK